MKTTEIVFRNGNGVPVTTSVIVAEYFEKNHKHVMEAIQDIIATAEKSAIVEIQELKEYFELSSYETMMPGNTGAVRKYPMYIMNEEGFTHLAMGFTGEKAKVFKQRYIKAFKAMRNVIQNQMDGTAQLMQAQQMITQNLLLLSQQMETMTRTNSLILERLERLESRPQDKPKGQRGKQLIKVRPSSPGYITVKDAVRELKARGVQVLQQSLYKYLRAMNYTSSDECCYNRPTQEWLQGGWMSFCSSGTRQVGDNPNIRRRYFTPLLGMAFIDKLETDLRKLYGKKNKEAQLAFGFGKEAAQ